ncbi:hypothetical protein VTN77DRAFT_8654 [Rasamsonia byssochlamydoides]|uniref:uncharacterized protein n=1 Tax=Rasamsonia byssochlamydoides TaxID=89139 RepID=UPI003741E9F7
MSQGCLCLVGDKRRSCPPLTDVSRPIYLLNPYKEARKFADSKIHASPSKFGNFPRLRAKPLRGMDDAESEATWWSGGMLAITTAPTAAKITNHGRLNCDVCGAYQGSGCREGCCRDAALYAFHHFHGCSAVVRNLSSPQPVTAMCHQRQVIGIRREMVIVDETH